MMSGDTDYDQLLDMQTLVEDGKRAIFTPAFFMFCLSFGCLFLLGICRSFTVVFGKNKRLARYYRAFQGAPDAEQPMWLHILGRHANNHFEVPPFFFLGVLFAIVMDAVTPFAVTCAWAFFGLRVLHTIVHLTFNNVTIRFSIFVTSVFALISMWVSVYKVSVLSKQ